MTPEDIKALRKTTGLSQRDLAEQLEVEVGIVREWEKGERFPTKAHCERMEALRANPPPRKSRKDRSPMELLGDPAFFLLVRKLLVHAPLRAELERMAAQYPDPLDDEAGGVPGAPSGAAGAAGRKAR